MIINILNRGENKFLKNGKLNEQIVSDLETYLKDRKEYQKEHLDAKVKDVSHHYEEWTENNQSVIEYTEYLLKCVKAFDTLNKIADIVSIEQQSSSCEYTKLKSFEMIENAIANYQMEQNNLK